MTKTMVMLMVLALLAQSGTAFAQGAPITQPVVEKKRFSDGLTIAGLTTILVGAVLMVPMEDPNATGYYIEGAGSYCVTSSTIRQRVSVTKGGCDDLPPMITAGFITMGAGAVMALIGFHKVEVSPQVGHKAVGAKLSVKW